jgi:hypothetical protein
VSTARPSASPLQDHGLEVCPAAAPLRVLRSGLADHLVRRPRRSGDRAGQNVAAFQAALEGRLVVVGLENLGRDAELLVGEAKALFFAMCVPTFLRSAWVVMCFLIPAATRQSFSIRLIACGVMGLPDLPARSAVASPFQCCACRGSTRRGLDHGAGWRT